MTPATEANATPDDLPHPRHRWTARIMAWALAVLVVAGAAGWGTVARQVIGHPRLQQPAAADAVIVLGPPDDGGVVEYGEELVNRGLAHTLLVSIAANQRGRYGHLCWDRPPHLVQATLTCFVPSPATTRGEARALTELVRQHDWHTVIVVTTPYHAERARMIFDRCPTGNVLFVAPPVRASTAHWIFESVYQTAGFLKALPQSGC